MTTNDRRELIIACRDLAAMHTDAELLELLDEAIDPSALAETIVEGSIETDRDDDIESPLAADEFLAFEIMRAMLELRFSIMHRD